MPSFRVHIRTEASTLSTVCDGSIELGRQKKDEPEPLAVVPSSHAPRIVLAAASELDVSRRQLRIEALADQTVLLTNASSNRSVALASGDRLAPGQSTQQTLPLELTIGGCKILISSEASAGAAINEAVEVLTLHHPAPRPGQVRYNLRSLASAQAADSDSKFASHRQLLEWLSLAMNVLQSAANESDFLDKAAQTALEIVGLDVVAVMMLERNTWQTRAVHGKTPGTSTTQNEHVWSPSQTILDQVRSSARTVRHLPQATDAPVSLLGVEALVAAPILDRDGVVVGALYGDRRIASGARSQPNISELEAMLVELLASGVAAGLARVEQERAAMEVRVQFERFFTPSLARHLMENPELLAGRDADVSVMFCDIRGFSRISQRLGPAKTMDLVGEVMDQLSDLVFAEEGVLVDYIGDELIAMWGAPDEQPDHALRACRAALAMLRQLPAINQAWSDQLQEPLRVGIGVCSGPARVGNTGSRKKFKYGPLGTTVNLASRIEGATKFFKTDLLIGDTTADAVREALRLRRLARVQVVNIPQPVALYEVLPPDTPRSDQEIAAYEKALGAFASGNYAAARLALKEFGELTAADGPRDVLLTRIEAAERDGPRGDDAVWELPGK